MRTAKTKRRALFAVATFVASTGVIVVGIASAAHPEASLAGSDFEIDDDANLKEDDPDPSIDWAGIPEGTGDGFEIRGTDLETGQNDDSYKGGVKEDTPCPGEVTGSIPNNKSDLLTFHGYSEEGDPGFFNFAWSRVSDPSGTTLMDFEFNQSGTACPQGPNVTRTIGDLLVEYAIDQGGARAEISGRLWTGTAWGPTVDLDDSTACGGGPCAAGTINTSVIPDAESDGLGEKQPRTFGEAQIDLRFLLGDPTRCVSFGSMMVKSRSSDSFTSQLKDFIRPIPVNLSNCATVIIRKETDPDGATQVFSYDHTIVNSPSVASPFTLTDGTSQEFNGAALNQLFTVEEDVPDGWALDDIDCNVAAHPSSGVTITETGAQISFTLDDPTDVVDCTYFNNELEGSLVIHKDRKHAAEEDGVGPHAGVTFTVSGEGDFVTDAGGDICVEGLSPGGYTITETLPAGYHNTDLVQQYTVLDGTTCETAAVATFTNTPLTDVTVSVDSQIDGGTASTIDCGDGPVETDANGDLTVNLDDVEPSVLVCTIVIDP